MKIDNTFILRVFLVISLIFYILLLFYINFITDEDFEFFSNEYKNCLKNVTKEKEKQTSSYRNEERLDCGEYIKSAHFFTSCSIIYAYIVLNSISKISILINTNNITTIQHYFLSINFFLYIFYITIYFGYGLSFDRIKRPKTGYKKLILLITNILIDIIESYLSFGDNKNQANKEYSNIDCLDACVINIIKERNWRVDNEISTISNNNNLLIEENQQLIELKKRRSSNNIEDGKVELILWYVKNNYNQIFSLNLLYKYLLEEIKNKFGEEINKDKFRNIFLEYAQEKFTESLTCPITDNIFLNPVITPEGQTYDKKNLLKYVEKKGENPLTRNKLFKTQLIGNILIKDLCEILQLNKNKYTIDIFIKMKNLLINPENNKFYSNPVVIKEGDRKGETKEGVGLITEYPNKVILNIIEQNKEILSDEFFEEINENKNIINNSNNNEETLKTETRLNININTIEFN